MPYLSIQTNIEVGSTLKPDLLATASKLVADCLGKPERYVMVQLSSNPDMLFAGSTEALAYLELKSIGLPEAEIKTLSSALCDLLSHSLNISAERVYIEFADAPRNLWGWNRGTF